MEIKNRKVHHNYFVEEEIECGIVLKGNEVKSIRSGMATIGDAWAQIQNGELMLRGMHITKWDTANEFDINEDRERVLLVHKKEIRHLTDMLKKKGYTLIPLFVYFNQRGKCKVKLGVCLGKHLYDKREAIKERDIKRKMEKEFKERNKEK